MERINCFTHGTVVTDLTSTQKFDAIHELILKAPIFRELGDLDHLEHAVVNREHLESTGFGNGVAVAHGKCTAVGEIVMALGVSRQGIEFDSMDGKPVHFLFIIANPPGMQLEYLLALSVLIRAVRDDRFRVELLECSDVSEIECRLSRAFRESMVKRGFPFN